MKMDLSTLFIGLISTLTFVLPFTLIYLNSKKRNAKAFYQLNKLAEQHNCQMQEKEIFAGLSFGIDTQKKVLFFVDSNENREQSKVLELENFAKCQINRVVKEFIVNNEKQSIITKIELLFTGKAGTKDEHIEIFDYEKKSQIFGELQLADRWNLRINYTMS